VREVYEREEKGEMRRDRFVVGFRGSKQTIYGKDEIRNGAVRSMFADPMTIAQARKAVLGLMEPDGRVRRVIHELVEVQGESPDER
jgi:hypothetical protein